MATPNYDNESTCTFLWKIENFNYLWLKRSQYIESPVFVVDELENSQWVMLLYPRGNVFAECINFSLQRKNDGSSEEDIDVSFELAFFLENGKILWSSRQQKHGFSKGEIYECLDAISQNEVFVRDKSVYLPLNTLTARCKIWRCDGKVGVDKYFLAETRVAVQRRSFQWKLKNFDTIGCYETEHLVIRSITNEILMKFELYLSGGQLGKEVINIDIHVFYLNAKFLFFQTFASNCDGEMINCGMKEIIWEGCNKKETLTLHLSKNQLQGYEHNRFLYLKNGALTLYCECILSTGIASEIIETVDSGIPSLNIAPPAVRNVGVHLVDDATSLREDLGSLCSRDVLSDMKLRTNTDTIPVHTQILGARSSVFGAMFVNDMKEKTKGCVDVTDLDDDTVRLMLLYMYTDKLEDLPWENAFQLYKASDKYDIASLRSKCNAILQAKLSPTNACQILNLANLHKDEELKKTSQKYILMQGETVFSSEEWKLLMKANIHLAAETMHLKWNKD
ncbi:speckle-type POZ protein-like B [Trichonephila clavata]|uniref:Speckle-type POZ protein-like B n=1 Tax=Trichonephila clavata TaxID=2740835 RepID=A0A8X6G0X1_TRICU|nr:speckle-type POZ protein-like B [Trichonephila clavata]